MDSHQAIYDAVRSRISNGDIGSAVSRAAYECFDISHAKQMLQQEIATVGYEMARPFAVLKPRMYPDGDMWCALYGDDLQEGVAGFGKTPSEAAAEFDKAWTSQTLKSFAERSNG